MGVLTGRTALVTGGSRGIGRATATRLARDGAAVAVHYGHDATATDEVVAAIRSQGGSAFPVRAELDTPKGVDELWDAFDQQVSQHAGRAGLDILVNNAGIAPRGAFEDTTEASFDAVFAINVHSPYFIVQEGLKRLRDGGRIINVTSLTARVALPDILPYSMSKSAIDTFTRTLAKELGGRNITVNAVAPGIVDTDINASWLRGNAEARAAASALSALGRVGEPEDVADIIAFLASNDSRWVTGHVLDASGGSHL